MKYICLTSIISLGASRASWASLINIICVIQRLMIFEKEKTEQMIKAINEMMNSSQSKRPSKIQVPSWFSWASWASLISVNQTTEWRDIRKRKEENFGSSGTFVSFQWNNSSRKSMWNWIVNCFEWNNWTGRRQVTEKPDEGSRNDWSESEAVWNGTKESTRMTFALLQQLDWIVSRVVMSKVKSRLDGRLEGRLEGRLGCRVRSK